MATLIKRTGSPFWFVAFDVPQPDGTVRRLKKSTKKKTQEEAMAEVSRILETERKLAVATDEQNRKGYEILSEAAKSHAKGELSETRIFELMSRFSEVATGKALKSYTVRSWSEEWLARKKTTKKATWNRYKTSVGRFLAWLGPKADAKLDSITRANAREFRDAIRAGWMPPAETAAPRTKKPSKPTLMPRVAKTANQYANDIASMFRAAVVERALIGNPFTGLTQLPEDDSTERRVFAPDEVRVLFAKAAEVGWQNETFSAKNPQLDARMARCKDWQGMILFGFYIGARLGDTAQLKWDNVNFNRSTVRFLPSKTSRRRKYILAPLHPRLLEWLEEQERPMDPCAPVFPKLSKTSTSGKSGLSLQFAAIMKYANVDRGLIREGKNGRRAQYARGYHSLRHTSNSAMADADVSQEIRRKIVGHETTEMNNIYTHHEMQKLAQEVGKLPRI
jgi:integrase